MIVRRAAASDVVQVSALEAELFGTDAWSPRLVEGELTHQTRCAVVAELGRTVIGYAALFVVGHTVDLQRIGVSGDHQRHGIARELLTALELDRYPRVLLEVRADNAAAVALYESVWFHPISTRLGYYGDGGDALVMQRG